MENENDANESATDPYGVEWDDEFADDTTIVQRNRTKYKATCVHQISLLDKTKLHYFKMLLPQNTQKNVLH